MKNLVSKFLLLTLTFFSCNTKKADEKLSIIQKPYLSNELLTNGYYYSTDANNVLNAIIFYNDGQIIIGSFGLDSINKLEEYFNSDRFKIQIKETKGIHGLFEINNTNLVFEQWYPDGNGSYKTLKSICSILDITTFKIYNEVYINGNQNIKNDTFHFQSFSPKPDSANSFIP